MKKLKITVSNLRTFRFDILQTCIKEKKKENELEKKGGVR